MLTSASVHLLLLVKFQMQQDSCHLKQSTAHSYEGFHEQIPHLGSNDICQLWAVMNGCCSNLKKRSASLLMTANHAF